MAVTTYAIPVFEPAKRPQGRVSLPALAPRKVAILGFGTVGRSVAEILCSGTFAKQLQLTHILNRNFARKQQAWVPAHVVWTDEFECVLKSDVELIVETVGGLHPAGDWVRAALRAGKSVVTANKQLIAMHGAELSELARSHGQRLEFGASVAGGVPVLNAVEHGLAGERLQRMEGILNGTCNYILSNMESGGVSMEAALKQAQELGYAEADPSDDVNGVDARCKLAILARIGFGLNVHPQQISAGTILRVVADDFQQARKLGCTIRQVAVAEPYAGQLRATVQPALVPRASALGQAHDNQNVLIARGKWGGETTFVGRGAGGGPTAVAVVSDLLSVVLKGEEELPEPHPARPTSVTDSFVLPRYVRMYPRRDIRLIVETLTTCGIGTEQVLRQPKSARSRVPFVFTAKPCSSKAVEDALQKCVEMGYTRGEALQLPILI